MAQKGTKRVKMGKYTISSHAQNRVVDPTKEMKKTDMVRNLFGNSYTTEPHIYKGELQYNKIHEKTKTETHLSMQNTVKTIHRIHNPKQQIRKFERRKHENNKPKKRKN